MDAKTTAKEIYDINAILKIMPHRYPFLLIDKIIDIELDKKIIGLKNVTFNEPFFQGHFPEKPIMPGVLIVEAMVQCGSILLLNVIQNPESKIALFSSIDNVKFRKPVLPGDQLVIEMEMTSYRRNLCKLTGKAYKNQLGGELVCSGDFSAFVVDK